MFFEFKVMCLNSDNSLKETLSYYGDGSENLTESVSVPEKDTMDKLDAGKGLHSKRDCDKTNGGMDELEKQSNGVMEKDQPEVVVAETYLGSSEDIVTAEEVEELKCEVSVTSFELMGIKDENSDEESEESGNDHSDQHLLEAETGKSLELNETQYPCQECWKPFCHCPLLIPHSHSHGSEHSFACDLCPLTFPRSSQLARHRASKHMQDEARPFKCPICGRSFGDATSQSRHMRMHASQRPFSCTLCPRAFNRHSSLVAHIAANHQQQQQLVANEIGVRAIESMDACDITSESPANGSLKRKRFICQLCSKSFSDSYTLQRHGRTHTGERPYPCSICGKTFSRSWSLARHVLLHTGERPHCCPLCGKRFADRSHLLRHVRTHGRAAAAAESALRAK